MFIKNFIVKSLYSVAATIGFVALMYWSQEAPRDYSGEIVALSEKYNPGFLEVIIPSWSGQTALWLIYVAVLLTILFHRSKQRYIDFSEQKIREDPFFR